jgi:hypothetical protein
MVDAPQVTHIASEFSAAEERHRGLDGAVVAAK